MTAPSLHEQGHLDIATVLDAKVELSMANRYCSKGLLQYKSSSIVVGFDRRRLTDVEKDLFFGKIFGSRRTTTHSTIWYTAHFLKKNRAGTPAA